MNGGQYVISQILYQLHWQTLNRVVAKYKGHQKVRHFTCRQQFTCMVFAQLTRRDGLRSIQDRLNARPEQLHHLGFSKPISKSTLADANESRDWRIWEQVALPSILSEKLGGFMPHEKKLEHI